MSQIIETIGDTLTKRPEVGIISSIAPFTMSTTEVLQLVGVILGLIIAIITGILKGIELKDKLSERKRKKREMNSSENEDQ